MKRRLSHLFVLTACLTVTGCGVEPTNQANKNTVMCISSPSTPMTMVAPINFAPAVAQRPIGPCAKTTTESPMSIWPDSAPLKPVEAISASSTTCSSDNSSGIFAGFACALGTRRYLLVLH